MRKAAEKTPNFFVPPVAVAGFESCLYGERSFSIIELIMKALHDHEHLATLQRYYAQHRVLPSYARLMEVLGYASKSAVKKVLERLEVAGMLERTPDGDWAPTERFFERVVANEPVPAGMPVTTLDDGVEQMTIDRYLIQEPGQTVLIRVKGDSMINAGIHSGDIAVVERRQDAQVGEQVVAVVDDQFTLKTLGRDIGGYCLLPANPEFDVIRPNGKLEIFGVVVGLVRRYT
jgi:repressor LexA